MRSTRRLVNDIWRILKTRQKIPANSPFAIRHPPGFMPTHFGITYGILELPMVFWNYLYGILELPHKILVLTIELWNYRWGFGITHGIFCASNSSTGIQQGITSTAAIQISSFLQIK